MPTEENRIVGVVIIGGGRIFRRGNRGDWNGGVGKCLGWKNVGD